MDKDLSQRQIAILGAARKLIQADGLAALSLRHLARALNMKAPSLYEHFSSREVLLAHVRRQEERALRDHLAEAIAPIPGPFEQAVSILRGYLDFFEERADRFEILFGISETQYKDISDAPAEGSSYHLLVETMADLAEAHGHPATKAGEWAFIAWSYVHGACVLRAGYLKPLKKELEPFLDAGIRTVIRGMISG